MFHVLRFTQSNYPPPQALRPPNPAPQTFQLNDLTMIDKQVHIRPIVLHVPREDFGVGRLEHDVIQAQRIGELAGDVGSPGLDAFGDAFGFDHEDLGAGVDEAFGAADGPVDVGDALGFEIFNAAGAAGAELDADLGLGI